MFIVIAGVIHQDCRQCRHFLPLDRFNRAPDANAGKYDPPRWYRHTCMACHNAERRERQEAARQAAAGVVQLCLFDLAQVGGKVRAV